MVMLRSTKSRLLPSTSPTDQSQSAGGGRVAPIQAWIAGTATRPGTLYAADPASWLATGAAEYGQPDAGICGWSTRGALRDRGVATQGKNHPMGAGAVAEREGNNDGLKDVAQ